mmetsp:Transcript_15263/g.38687  ORF Transcript_15263/g.38687 Transcript_15263/m.38687 type:complete len:315 (-) Transcript_15263:4871-5815(-)
MRVNELQHHLELVDGLDRRSVVLRHHVRECGRLLEQLLHALLELHLAGRVERAAGVARIVLAHHGARLGWCGRRLDQRPHAQRDHLLLLDLGRGGRRALLDHVDEHHRLFGVELAVVVRVEHPHDRVHLVPALDAQQGRNLPASRRGERVLQTVSRDGGRAGGDAGSAEALRVLALLELLLDLVDGALLRRERAQHLEALGQPVAEDDRKWVGALVALLPLVLLDHLERLGDDSDEDVDEDEEDDDDKEYEEEGAEHGRDLLELREVENADHNQPQRHEARAKVHAALELRRKGDGEGLCEREEDEQEENHEGG